MPDLKKELKLSDHVQKKKIDPAIQSRTKLIAALRQQIKIATAQSKNEIHSVHKLRYKTEDGVRVQQAVEVIPKPWFWSEGNLIYLSPKVGLSALELETGKPTIEISESKELIPTLNLLIQLVDDGQLDTQIGLSKNRKKKN